MFNGRKYAAAVMLLGLLCCAAFSGKVFGKGRAEGPVEAGMSAQEAVAAALERLEQAESMETRLSLDLEAKAFGLPVDAQADLDLVAFQEPMKVKADMVLDAGLFGSDAYEAYVRQVEGRYQLFVKNAGRWNAGRWNAREVQPEQLLRYNGKQMLITYLKHVEDLNEIGEPESLPDSKACRYTGVLRSDGLQDVLLGTGSVELLLGILEQDGWKPLGALLRKNEERLLELMGKAEDLPVTIWIDQETGYPMQCSMEISDSVNAALKELTADEKKGFLKQAAARLWSHVEVTDAKLVIQCGGFNSVDDFPIPKEALQELAD